MPKVLPEGSIADALVKLARLVTMLDDMAGRASIEGGWMRISSEELAEAHALAIDVWECL